MWDQGAWSWGCGGRAPGRSLTQACLPLWPSRRRRRVRMRSPRSRTAPQEPLLGTVHFAPTFHDSFPGRLHQPVFSAPAAAAHQTRRTITSSSLAPISTCLTPNGQWSVGLRPAKQGQECRWGGRGRVASHFVVPSPPQVEAPTAGAAEAARLHAGNIHGQHAEPRRPHHPGHEHGAAVYEGPRQPNARCARRPGARGREAREGRDWFRRFSVLQ